jgi:predicted nucleic acid-binding protein
MPLSQLDSAIQRMELFLDHCDTVPPTEEVRRRARRLLAVHSLRAADALQLAAALVFCEDEPGRADFACLDDRLRGAASKEGFRVLPA